MTCCSDLENYSQYYAMTAIKFITTVIPISVIGGVTLGVWYKNSQSSKNLKLNTPYLIATATCVAIATPIFTIYEIYNQQQRRRHQYKLEVIEAKSKASYADRYVKQELIIKKDDDAPVHVHVNDT